MGRVAGWIIAFAALAALPAVMGNPYARHVLINALIFCFAALGLNLTFGYSGQHAFGHPVFFGVGAYASALLAMRAGWPVELAIAGGAVITGGIAAAVGYPCFRLRGIYFGVATFAFARVIYIIAQNWIGLTRGPMGIPSIPPLDVAPVERALGIGREPLLHAMLVALLGVTLFLLQRVIRSPLGRAWIAIRENEDLAASVGIPPLRYKMSAFAGGGVLAGVGGALYAHYVSFVSPTELGWHYIGIVFIMVIAGGTGSLLGPVVGALVFGVLPEVLRVAEVARNLLLGGVLLLSIAFLPEGLVGLWGRTLGRRGGPGAPPALAPSAPPAAPSNPGTSLGASAEPLEVRGVTKRFGGLVALHDVSFRVEPGEIVGLIGPNGAGKTTLFNVMTGFLQPTAGGVAYGGAPLSGCPPATVARRGVARTFQITSLFPDLSVVDNVRTATHLWARRDLGGALLRTRAFRMREAEIERVVDEAIRLVRLTELRDVPARALSYGAQRGLEVAVALATRCRLLLLDEPAAGLSPEETERLRELILGLRARGLTIVVIEHHMRLVMGLCDRIVVLNYGERIAEGPPERIVADPRVIEAYLGAEGGHA